MIANIVGSIWIILGLLWLIKPGILRNRLKKKMNRKIKWAVYGFIALLALTLIGSIIKAPGILLKIIGFIGIIIVIKGILLVTSKTSEKMLDWWAKRPLMFFRVWALFIFAVGLVLVLS